MKGAEGRFSSTLSYPRDGHVVRIEADGYTPVQSRVLRNDEGAVELTFSLEKEDSPLGRVRSPQGAPIAGASVYLCAAGNHLQINGGRTVRGPGMSEIVTDAEGRFSFVPPSDAFLAVVIHESGYAEVSEDGFDPSAEITLQPWCRVEGTLRIGSELAINETVGVWYNRPHERDRPDVMHDYTASTDSAGTFAFDRVVPGLLWVGRKISRDHVMTRSVAVSHGSPVEIGPGETARVQIGGTGRPVTGKLTATGATGDIDWASGRHLHLLRLKLPEIPFPKEEMAGRDQEEIQAWFRVWGESPEGQAHQRARRSYTVLTQRDGTFRVDDIPAGTYELLVTLMQPPGSSPLVGHLQHDFEVPDMDGGRSDGPLDLGTLEVNVQRVLQVGDPAPHFKVETLDGEQLSLSELRGKCVLLSFWSTWCAPCTAELPHFHQIHGAYTQDDRFAMIGLSVDSEIEAARKYAERHELRWPQGFLGEVLASKVAMDYGVQGVPATFLIGPDGRIMARDLRGVAIEAVVEKAVEGMPSSASR